MSLLRLNANLKYDKAVTDWWFDILGYGDWVVSQQILRKLLPCARHGSDDPRDGGMRRYDFLKPVLSEYVMQWMRMQEEHLGL